MKKEKENLSLPSKICNNPLNSFLAIEKYLTDLSLVFFPVSGLDVEKSNIAMVRKLCEQKDDDVSDFLIFIFSDEPFEFHRTPFDWPDIDSEVSYKSGSSRMGKCYKPECFVNFITEMTEIVIFFFSNEYKLIYDKLHLSEKKNVR